MSNQLNIEDKYSDDNHKIIHFPCGPKAEIKITSKTPFMDEYLVISPTLSLIYNVNNKKSIANLFISLSF